MRFAERAGRHRLAAVAAALLLVVALSVGFAACAARRSAQDGAQEPPSAPTQVEPGDDQGGAQPSATPQPEAEAAPDEGAAASVTVVGLSTEAASLLGGDVKALEEALGSWCEAYFPSATEAVWGGVVTIDYENHLVTSEFTVEGEESIPVTAIYHSDNGGFQFDG